MISEAAHWIFLILLSTIVFSAFTLQICRKFRTLLPAVFILSIVIFQLLGSVYQVAYLKSMRPLFFSGDGFLMLTSGIALSCASLLLIPILRPLLKTTLNSFVPKNYEVKLRNQLFLDLMILLTLSLFLVNDGLDVFLSIFREGNYVQRIELRNKLFFTSPYSRIYILGMITLPAFTLGIQASKAAQHLIPKNKKHFEAMRTLAYILIPCLSGSKGVVMICSTVAILSFIISKKSFASLLNRKSVVVLTMVSAASLAFFSFAGTGTTPLFSFFFRVFGVYGETFFALYEAWKENYVIFGNTEQYFHQYMYYFPGNATIPTPSHFLIKYGLAAYFISSLLIPFALFVIESIFKELSNENNPVFCAILSLMIFHTTLLATLPPSGTIFSTTYLIMYFFIYILFLIKPKDLLTRLIKK
ncbi:hypothetical protein [Bdellovibrio bacteriovorus]|uniref:hypothetical protein n=1 Tax=Bdellovibrio bacteriovorus TaxID=959 RepID=UPI0035A57AD1